MADFWRIGRAALNFIGGDIDDRYVRPFHPHIQSGFLPGQPEWIQIDGREGDVYNTCAPLAVVVDRKAELKAVGRYRHWKGNKNTKEDTELFNTPDLNRLYNPNPLQSKDDFIKEFSIHRDIFGAAYNFGLWPVNKKLSPVPEVLWNMQPELVSFETTGRLYTATTMADIYKKIWFNLGGSGEFEINPEHILIRSIGNATNILAPQSPLTKLKQEISNIVGSMAYRNVVLRKKGAIGILSGDQRDGDGSVPLDTAEFARIEKQYQASWGLYSQQMQVLLSRYPMRWQAMTPETNKMELFREVDENMFKIIDKYGMNQNLFSFAKGTSISESGGKMVQAERQAYQNKIIPESEDDMNAYSKWTGLHEKGEYITLDYSHVPAMQEDEELAAKVMTAKIGAFVSMIALENKVTIPQAMELAGLKEG